MSHSDKDQRGGHRTRRFDTYSCMCCPILEPKEKSRNRTTRNRALDRFEKTADPRP